MTKPKDKVFKGLSFVEEAPVSNLPGKVSRITAQEIRNKKLVAGAENYQVEKVLGVVHVLWMTGQHRLPTVKEICDRVSDIDPAVVLRILKHKRFRTMCLGRNIQWPENWNEGLHNGAVLRSNLRPEQAHVLAIILEPTREGLAAKLKKAGINQSTWTSWLNDPLFAEAVRVSSENMLGSAQAAIHAAVVNGAAAGNVQQQRLFYELTQRHDPAKQQTQDLGRVVALLLEVLTRHVTDPRILKDISTDVDTIMRGNRLQELEALPANYEVVKVTTDEEAVSAILEPTSEIPDGFFDLET